MSDLIKFIIAHTLPAVADDPEAQDLIFFAMKPHGDPSPERLRELIAQHPGEFCEVDPLDGDEHSYIELGGWIGDQGLALRLMGLGAALGLWELLTPRTILGKHLPADQAERMAGMGLVTIMVVPA